MHAAVCLGLPAQLWSRNLQDVSSSGSEQEQEREGGWGAREREGEEARRGGFKGDRERSCGGEAQQCRTASQPASRAGRCDRGGEGEEDLGSAADTETSYAAQAEEEGERKTLGRFIAEGKEGIRLEDDGKIKLPTVALDLHLHHHFGPMLTAGFRSRDGVQQSQRPD
ncbi:hypothetical protein D9C73_007814 [Collichthys lucidus]|uniref:Uncharacterized protein n=1 Tax=Collichthys lucidus TaxID=240159 RepID=A0A4U5UGK6_COLLU|nr:hypothetical protein D9C73_007814 [Collichthys lucidus]